MVRSALARSQNSRGKVFEPLLSQISRTTLPSVETDDHAFTCYTIPLYVIEQEGSDLQKEVICSLYNKKLERLPFPQVPDDSSL
jgi:hypothetical protein